MKAEARFVVLLAKQRSTDKALPRGYSQNLTEHNFEANLAEALGGQELQGRTRGGSTRGQELRTPRGSFGLLVFAKIYRLSAVGSLEQETQDKITAKLKWPINTINSLKQAQA